MGRKLPSATLPQSTTCKNLRELGLMLRAHRGALKLRIDDAAKAAGVSTDVLSRMENGNSVTTDNMFKVMALLGLSLDISKKESCLVIELNEKKSA